MTKMASFISVIAVAATLTILPTLTATYAATPDKETQLEAKVAKLAEMVDLQSQALILLLDDYKERKTPPPPNSLFTPLQTGGTPWLYSVPN